eukprot:UN07293
MATQQTMNIGQIIVKYEKALQEDAKRRGKVYVVLDDIDEEYIEEAIEDEDISALEYIQSIPYIFISHNASDISDRLYNSSADVVHIRGGCTNTASAPAFQSVFKKELNKCQQLFKQKDYKQCGDTLIAILLTLKHWPHGFYDCDNYDEAQRILDKFGKLWSKVMGSSSVSIANQSTNHKH